MNFGKPEVIFGLSAVVMEINHSNRTQSISLQRQHSRAEWMAIMNQPLSECSNL